MVFKDPGKKRAFGKAQGRAEHYPEMGWVRKLMSVNLRAEAVVNLDEVESEIDPRLYGLSAPGADLSLSQASLLKDLHPALLRAEVGKLPPEEDQETERFLTFCEESGAEAYLVLDLRSMTPEAAADWVAYCTAPADDEGGAQRAARGHFEPYPVKLWGLAWNTDSDAQAEPADPADYVRQVRTFIEAMRAVDPEIRLVGEGKVMLPGGPEDAETWNRSVLGEIGGQLDALSIRIVHPGEGADESPADPERLYHSLLSAPHSVEESIRRLADLIREVVPGRELGIVLDGFGLQSPGAASLRDGLYVAGMLNAFHRQSASLKAANLAQAENALPLTVQAEEQPAFPTPLYFPYLLYSKMEPQLLASAHWSPVFQAEALGDTISARNQVPYIDLTATRSVDGRRVVLAVTNRSPQRRAAVMVNLKGEDNRKFRVAEAWLMSGPDPLVANTADAPEKVGAKAIKLPKLRFAWLDLDLPSASLMLVVLEKVR